MTVTPNPAIWHDRLPGMGAWLNDFGQPYQGSVVLEFDARLNRSDGLAIHPANRKYEYQIGDPDQQPQELRDHFEAYWRAFYETAGWIPYPTVPFTPEAWDDFWTRYCQAAIFFRFPANDDPDVIQHGWKMHVIEKLTGAKSEDYWVAVPLKLLDSPIGGININSTLAVPNSSGKADLAIDTPGGLVTIGRDGKINPVWLPEGTWDGLAGKPRYIAAGATPVAARTAIGAASLDDAMTTTERAKLAGIAEEATRNLPATDADVAAGTDEVSYITPKQLKTQIDNNPGPQGPVGPQGPAGTGVTILGSFGSPSELPPTGNNGDAFLVQGDLYVWYGTDWDNVGNIKGPEGPPGANGVGIDRIDVSYVVSDASVTAAPATGWVTTLPTVPKGQKLWTRMVSVLTNGNQTTAYTSAVQGEDGAPGKAGVGVTNITRAYNISADGVTPPGSGWQPLPVAPTNDSPYMWTRNTFSFTNGNFLYSFSCARSGTDGAPGQPGTNGVGIDRIDVSYVVSDASVTAAPATGWVTTLPTVPKGQKLWTRMVSVLTNGNQTTAYTSAVQGEDGAPGKAGVGVTNITRAYNISADGVTPPGSGWQPLPVAPTNDSPYMWTRNTFSFTNGNFLYSFSCARSGTDGAPGQPGTNGVGISTATTEYQLSAAGTTAPTGTWSSKPLVQTSARPFLWARTTTRYTDSSETLSYSVSRRGEDAPGVGNATTTVAGLVTLADSADVVAGTPGKAVTTDQLATALDNKAAGLAGATGAFGGVYPSEAAIRAAYPNLGQGEKNTVFFVPEVN